MKKCHITFSDHEYQWLKAVAEHERRSVVSLVEYLTVAALRTSFAAMDPEAPGKATPVPAQPEVKKFPRTPVTNPDDIVWDE